MEVLGNIHSFESFGTLDGPGIRYIIFLQGCSLRCKYCHNVDTWAVNNNNQMSVDEVMSKIISCKKYLHNGGVTLSGGEPLLQLEFVEQIILACHKEELHVAIDTAGSVNIEKSKKVIDLADMLLLDIKALDNQLCETLTGQSNINTLATLNYCEATNKDVWIRHVLVPTFTATDENLKSLAIFLSKYKCIKKVELLSYHKLGDYKWENLGVKNELTNIPELSPQEFLAAKELFNSYYTGS